MARSARSKSRPSFGWPALEAVLVERLRGEPPARHLGWVLMLAVAGLYAAGLDYPLVAGDFAFLGPQQFEAYRSAWPALGGSWLADATLGWWATLAGSHWPWHRGLNLALHAGAAWVAFTMFRALLLALGAGRSAIAPGWIAFFAAALFALHPAAVYAVAYLSARYALLGGLFALIALWGTTRGVQDGGRGLWLLGPAATAAALACSPAGLGIPAAMAFLAAALPETARSRRRAWIGVALAGCIAAIYAFALAVTAVPAAAVAPAYLDTLAASSSRFLQYLGLWIVPVTAAMAVDMPQAVASTAVLWPGWLGILGVVLLAALIGAVVVRCAQPLLRTGAIAAGIAVTLYTGELFWPRLGEEYALARSYMYMPCVALIPACLVAALPLRSAWIAAAFVAVLWLVTAAQALVTFSSHTALWDDAVRRIERLGAKSEDARVYLNRATVLRREGHTVAAVADYDRALALQPNLTRALRGRAQVHLDEKRYADALRDLDRVLELEPQQALVHADRGLVLMQAGRLQDAGRAFDSAIERGAQEPRVFLNRGLARLQLGGAAAAAAALADIEQALARDPRYALAYFNRAVVFELAANAGMRLRDAVSPELMRAVASQNLRRACDLGYRPACERVQSQAADIPQGAQEGPVRATPERLRSPEVPAGR